MAKRAKKEEGELATGNMIESQQTKQTTKIIQDYNQEIIDNYMENFESHLVQKQLQVAESIQNYIAKIDPDGAKNEVELSTILKAKSDMLMPIILRAMGKDLSTTYSEPMLSAQNLAIVFDYYQEMMADLAMQGIQFPPTRQNFCAFAGITSTTYNIYLESADIHKKTITQKIEDYIVENTWTNAMTGKLNAGAVEKRTKLSKIGGGYTEAKADYNINLSRDQAGTPENMLSNLAALLNSPKPNIEIEQKP